MQIPVGHNHYSRNPKPYTLKQESAPSFQNLKKSTDSAFHSQAFYQALQGVSKKGALKGGEK